MIPRWLHHLRAVLGGYFWLPCPLCGRMFGGHEWRDIGGKSSSIGKGEGGGMAICPTCTRAGRGEPWIWSAERRPPPELTS